MLKIALVLAASVSVCAGCRAPAATGADTALDAERAVEQLVRVRCATDGRDVFVTWRGQIRARVAGEPPRHLFDTVGVNIARCKRAAQGWYLTSRELMLYLDPVTGEVLHRWTNPWTGDAVSVVHVANNPVQSRLTRAPAPAIEDGVATYTIAIPLSYPNPLAGDPALAAYSPAALYEATETFSLSAPADELTDAAQPWVSGMTLVWRREGPWLPWMAMGDRAGRLDYHATGQRVDALSDVPAALRAEIDERLPRYRSAPTCFLAADNVTSWTYFATHVDAYRRGERFPRPEPAGAEPCAEPR